MGERPPLGETVWETITLPNERGRGNVENQGERRVAAMIGSHNLERDRDQTEGGGCGFYHPKREGESYGKRQIRSYLSLRGTQPMVCNLCMSQ